MSAKTRMYAVRMSKAEKDLLKQLADHYGLTCSAMVRFLLREREREIQSSVPEPDHGAWSAEAGFNVDA